jgi:hypothetical protein
LGFFSSAGQVSVIYGFRGIFYSYSVIYGFCETCYLVVPYKSPLCGAAPTFLCFAKEKQPYWKSSNEVLVGGWIMLRIQA